jgi:proteasome accessory factor B
VTARKSERLMNLTICLLVARHYVPKQRIRQAVEGYHNLSDDAFDRMFDRDKDELRGLGVPIEVGTITKAFEDEPGYRIRRDRFELPEIELEPDEAAVVGLAARVWQHASLASATTQGLRKLRAGGVPVDDSAVSVLEPKLAADEPAFEPMFDAVTTRRPVEFDYRRAGADATSRRRLLPWGVVSWHGHWYTVGLDQDRDAPRMFRLSRIEGQVSVGEPNSYEVPEDLDLRGLASSLAPPDPHKAATVRVRVGAGDPLRRRATSSIDVDDNWTELQLAYGDESSFADELTSFGPDVMAVAPPELRGAVVNRLRAVTEAAGGR